MAHDTELASLILRMRESLSTDIREAKQDVVNRCNDIVARQIEQNGRVNRHEALIAAVQTLQSAHGLRLEAVERGDLEAAKALSRLEERSKGTIRAFIASLTPKQKAVFWSAATAGATFLAERGYAIGRALLTLFRAAGQS